MSDRSADILVIVEGAKTDVRLMERLLRLYGIDKRHQIVSYNTNIYALYNSIFSDPNPESLDLQLHLRSRETDPNKKTILDHTYAETLLIFDFDPHDIQFTEDKIRKMAEFFSESTEMGKLYINYPMVEAFYHVKSVVDTNYFTYVVTMDELISKQYKGRVGVESCANNYNNFPANKDDCSIIIRQNISKAWHMLGLAANTTAPASLDILAAQIATMNDTEAIAVLCTCVFYIVDYNPALLV